MATKIYLRVCDEDGQPLAMKPAWLTPRDDHHALAEFHSEGDDVQSLELNAQTMGDVQLVLRMTGHPDLGFAMHARDGHESPFAFRKQMPRCASLTRQTVTRGSDQSVTIVALQFNLTKQHEEVVMVTGVDLKGKTDYKPFANTLRDDLYRGTTYFGGTPQPIPRAIYDHTIVTLFDFKTGYRLRYIKGQKGWHQLDAVLLGAKAPYIEHGKETESERIRHDEDTISIAHVYDYIAKLGAVAPRTLQQVNYFSHAWVQGAVLLNTNEDTEYQVMNCKGVRDPRDKDPRCKDFCEENIPNFTSFCAAFASTAFVKTWGCFRHALYDYVEAVADLEDPEAMRPAGTQGLSYNSHEIAEMIRGEAFRDSYLGNLIMKTGIDGFGSLPTTASNYQRVGSRYYMFVDRNSHGRHMGWFERNFDVALDAWGYVDYRKLG